MDDKFEFGTKAFYPTEWTGEDKEEATPELAKVVYLVRGERAVGQMESNPSLEETRSYHPETVFSEEDQEAVYKIEMLISILSTIREKIDGDEVKLRFSDDRPLMISGKDNDTRIMASLAPFHENSYHRGRLNPIEANLLGYHVLCKEDGCEWRGSRYLGVSDAKEAAKEHRYLTGHQFKIYDYEGNRVQVDD